MAAEESTDGRMEMLCAEGGFVHARGAMHGLMLVCLHLQQPAALLARSSHFSLTACMQLFSSLQQSVGAAPAGLPHRGRADALAFLFPCRKVSLAFVVFKLVLGECLKSA